MTPEMSNLTTRGATLSIGLIGMLAWDQGVTRKNQSTWDIYRAIQADELGIIIPVYK